MGPLDALILGLVEGITEYLPVSSTGHLVIVSALLGLDEPPETKHAVDAFSIVIQGGAILAVLGLYRRRVWQMLRGLAGRDAAGRRLATNLIVAFLPAAILGVLLDEAIERYLFHPTPVIAALAVGGVLMIVVGPVLRRLGRTPRTEGDVDALETLTWRGSLVIGFAQCLAMWPGTSRSMVTIVGGMAMRLPAAAAAEFSFLLGLPTLGGACVYKLTKNLADDGPSLFDVLGVAPVVIGFVTATISAALAVAWLVAYLNRHGLALFGWYRIALAAVLTLLILQGVVRM